MREFILVVCLLVAAAVASAAETPRLESIDEMLRKRVDPDGPGAAVLVARDGAILHECFYGMADVQRHVPIAAATRFDLASCSKQFTAMAIMILAGRGLLSHDDDARKVLPELPPPRDDHPLRIADLLHMTSGLPDYTEMIDDLRHADNTTVLKAIAKAKPKWPPGEKDDYCNTNYALLALMVHRISGRPFSEFAHDEIFAPLGMSDTLVMTRSGMDLPGRAEGYALRKHEKAHVRDDTGVVGDGQVITTVGDLLKWDLGIRANKLVDARAMELAYTPCVLTNRKATTYGFGLEITHEHGRRWAWHEGVWNGANTYFSRDLDHGCTVIVLSNDESIGAGKIGAAIEAELAQPHRK